MDIYVIVMVMGVIFHSSNGSNSDCSESRINDGDGNDDNVATFVISHYYDADYYYVKNNYDIYNDNVNNNG